MARRPTSTTQRRDNARFWVRLYESSIPLLDSLNNFLAGRQLARLTAEGSSTAAAALAKALAAADTSEIPRFFQPWLETPPPAPACDVFWQSWLAKRSPALTTLLQTWGLPASQPVEVRVVSLLWLDSPQSQVEKCGPAAIPALINALTDANAAVRARAHAALASLQQKALIHALCAWWARTRDPQVEALIAARGYQPEGNPDVVTLWALKFGHPEHLLHADAALIPALIAACSDPDPIIAQQAAVCLPLLQNPDAIDAFCQAWVNTRSPELTRTLLQARYITSAPGLARTLTALMNNAIHEMANCRPEEVPFLLDALQDADREIALRARQALSQLTHPESQAEVCRQAVERDAAAAFEIARSCRYLPEAPEDRALFFFLSDQWDQYDALDFDHRLMRAAYADAAPDMRQRIARHIQKTGRTQVLDILAPLDTRNGVVSLTPLETSVLLRTLEHSRDWPRLWDLCFQLRLADSAQIVQKLHSAGWTPDRPSDAAVFTRLVQLAEKFHGMALAAALKPLPPALVGARLKVHGRVNDLAFSPVHPWLAIGTGARKVVIWDYQQGRIQNTLSGFDHSIGRVAFMPSNQLVCGERGRPPAPCAVYAGVISALRRLTAYPASVTAIQPLPNGALLVAARDGSLELWTVADGVPLRQIKTINWPRAAGISPTGDQFALLDHRIRLYALPSLEPIGQIDMRRSSRKRIEASVAQCACFTPDGAGLLVGQANGQVLRFNARRGHFSETGERVTTHAARVVDIAYRSTAAQYLTAGADGVVHFFSHPDLIHVGKVASPIPSPLTSMHLSPDQRFLATGHRDDSLVLWDLRAHDLPELLDRPLASGSPQTAQMAASLAALEGVPETICAALQYMETALHHRFQYDVQVSEILSIQPGQFDIVVE